MAALYSYALTVYSAAAKTSGSALFPGQATPNADSELADMPDSKPDLNAQNYHYLPDPGLMKSLSIACD